MLRPFWLHNKIEYNMQHVRYPATCSILSCSLNAPLRYPLPSIGETIPVFALAIHAIITAGINS
jgi:hypothetical protein